MWRYGSARDALWRESHGLRRKLDDAFIENVRPLVRPGLPVSRLPTNF